MAERKVVVFEPGERALGTWKTDATGGHRLLRIDFREGDGKDAEYITSYYDQRTDRWHPHWRRRKASGLRKLEQEEVGENVI